MRPTLAAEELKTNLTQYLSTTFALADPPVREALEKFLNHPANGIFRGPYLRIRTPFRTADEGLAGHPGVGAGASPFRTCIRCRRGGGCRALTVSRSRRW